MHVRFRSCLHMPVVEVGDETSLGTLTGILLHPDTGRVEGFFARSTGLLGAEDVYCSALDIVRWGTRVYVASSDALAPAEDRIRLQSLLQDDRTVLHQRVVTQSGRFLGRCRDVQFNTDTMRLEWIFPRWYGHWGVALPASEILEISAKAIIVRNQIKPARDTLVRTEEAELPEGLPVETPV